MVAAAVGGVLTSDTPRGIEVKDLFERVRVCVKKSRGDVFEITEKMLAYRKLEELLAEKLGEEADKAQDAHLEELKKSPRYLPTPFPAPEPGGQLNEEGMFFRRVVLKGFEYPTNEFTTSGKQYTFVGSPVQGYYFVELSNRDQMADVELMLAKQLVHRVARSNCQF